MTRSRTAAITAIKAVHSAIFFALLGSLLVFAQRGATGRSDRIAAVTAARTRAA